MTKPTKTARFVTELRRIALDQGLSGYALAKASGVPLSTVQRFLQGDLNATASTLEALAQALGVRVVVEGA